VGLDGLVYLVYQADGLLERHDNALVVGDVLLGEGAAGDAFFAAPVVQPFAANLVTADVKVPHVFGETVGVKDARPLGGVEIHLALLVALAFAEDVHGGAVETLDEGDDGVLGIDVLPRLAIILV